MKTDRQLIEDAAEAFGLPECGWMGPAFMYVKDNCFTDWNPLADKGDAVSLLLKLKLRVDYVDGQPCIDGVLQSGMTAEESFCRAVTCAAAARVAR
jgi:hypothetical protein